MQKPLSKAEGPFVRGMRFELTHPFGRYHLKVVRLPISPPTHTSLGNFEVAAKIVLSALIPTKNSPAAAYFNACFITTAACRIAVCTAGTCANGFSSP